MASSRVLGPQRDRRLRGQTPRRSSRGLSNGGGQGSRAQTNGFKRVRWWPMRGRTANTRCPLLALLRHDGVTRKICGWDRPAEMTVFGGPKNVAGFPDMIGGVVEREGWAGCKRMMGHELQGR